MLCKKRKRLELQDRISCQNLTMTPDEEQPATKHSKVQLDLPYHERRLPLPEDIRQTFEQMGVNLFKGLSDVLP